MTRHQIIDLNDLLESTDRPRQRQQFDPVALLELAQSIEKHGLLHAIVVRLDGRTLISGERRCRAIEEHLAPLGKAVRYGGETLPVGWIPVVPVDATDDLALEEIELDENLKRKDLTWQEHAAAVARLHALRVTQNQAVLNAEIEADVVLHDMSPAHTIADTAREVYPQAADLPAGEMGHYQNQVRLEVLLAKHLDKPEVATAKSAKDAFKALKKIEDGERNRTIAAAVGATYTAGVHKIFNANCLEWMTGPEWQGKFDVIVTDPPYGMGAHEFGDGAGKLAGIDHEYDDSYEHWLDLMCGDAPESGTAKGWCQLSYAVAKPQAHAYVFCDPDNFHKLRDAMRLAGWYVFRTPLINVKNSGRVPLPDKGPRRQYEICLYAIKGDKLTTGIFPDVIQTAADEQMSHGAQKPVALYEDLLRRSARPGDWVLDTFGGTGTLLPAAHAMKLTAVVVEQNPTYYGICAKRLEALSAQQELSQ